LLHAVDEDDGATFNDEEIRDQLLGLFVAGHETTAVLLTWTLYLLAKHPEIQEKLYQHVCSQMQGDVPSLEDLEAMTYTDAVLNESMRLYPPAWSLFVRQVVEPLQVGEYTLDVGKLVYISPWVMHHDKRWWQNPEQFDPSRFEGDWKAQRPNFAYMPFGGGSRVCVGSHLAEMEVEVILATMVKHFIFELSEPNQIAKPDAKFTVHPEGGMKLKVRSR
jgi:cytochrome P450